MDSSGVLPPSLDTVLLDFRAEAGIPSPSLLDTYCRRYPQFARELTNYALTWLIDSALTQDATPAEEIDASLLVSRAIARLYERRRTGDPAKDVLARTAHGPALNPFAGVSVHRVRAIRDELGIDTPLFAKFRNRLIDPNTVSPRLLQRFAQLLNRTLEEFVTYLNRPAMAHAAADYKAQAKPSVGARKEVFGDAVRASSLDETQKQILITG